MDATDRHDYPSQYESGGLLKDGSTAHVRPLRPGDAAALRDLFRRMSPHALFLRYHRRVPEVSEEEIRRYTDTDYAETFALAATTGEDPSSIVGVALYSHTAPGRAEVAFVVEEAHQGLGVASRLLDQLAAAAHDHGIHVFEADVLGENQPMMDVFRDSGYRVETNRCGPSRRNPEVNGHPSAPRTPPRSRAPRPRLQAS